MGDNSSCDITENDMCCAVQPVVQQEPDLEYILQSKRLPPVINTPYQQLRQMAEKHGIHLPGLCPKRVRSNVPINTEGDSDTAIIYNIWETRGQFIHIGRPYNCTWEEVREYFAQRHARCPYFAPPELGILHSRDALAQYLHFPIKEGNVKSFVNRLLTNIPSYQQEMARGIG